MFVDNGTKYSHGISTIHLCDTTAIVPTDCGDRECTIYGVDVYNEDRPWILVKLENVDRKCGWIARKDHIKEYSIKDGLIVCEDFKNNLNELFWWFPLPDIKIIGSFWEVDLGVCEKR